MKNDRLTYANFGMLLAYIDGNHRTAKRLQYIRELKEEFAKFPMGQLLDIYTELHEITYFQGDLFIVDVYKITTKGELLRARQHSKQRIRSYINGLLQEETNTDYFEVLMRYYTRTIGGKTSPYYQEKAGLTN